MGGRGGLVILRIVKNLIWAFFWVIFILVISLVVYTRYTGNNPVSEAYNIMNDYQIVEPIENREFYFDKDNMTLTIDEGTFYFGDIHETDGALLVSDIYNGNLVLTYRFEPSQDFDFYRPSVLLESFITLYQADEELDTGGIKKDTHSEQYRDLVDTSLVPQSGDEPVDGAVVYAYHTDKGDITIQIAGNQFTYTPQGIE